MMKYLRMKSREIDVAACAASNLERHLNRLCYASVRRAGLVEMLASTLKKMAVKNQNRMVFVLLVLAVSLVAARDA
jgi:hypothetical protein